MKNVQWKKIIILVLLVLCSTAMFSQAIAQAWLVGQTLLDHNQGGLGVAGNIGLGAAGIYWSAAIGFAVPAAGVVIAL